MSHPNLANKVPGKCAFTLKGPAKTSDELFVCFWWPLQAPLAAHIPHPSLGLNSPTQSLSTPL